MCVGLRFFRLASHTHKHIHSEYLFIMCNRLEIENDPKWKWMEQNEENIFVQAKVSPKQHSPRIAYYARYTTVQNIIVFPCICLSTIFEWLFIIGLNILSSTPSPTFALSFIPSLCTQKKYQFSHFSGPKQFPSLPSPVQNRLTQTRDTQNSKCRDNLRLDAHKNIV